MMANGSKRGSIEELEEKVHQYPNSGLFVYLAEELQRTGNLDQAVTVLEEGLKRRPDFVSARTNLGNVYLLMGKPEQAAAELIHVVEAIPDNVFAQQRLGDAYREMGMKEEAATQYRLVLELDPDDIRADQYLAMLEEDEESEGMTDSGAEMQEGEFPSLMEADEELLAGDTAELSSYDEMDEIPDGEPEIGGLEIGGSDEESAVEGYSVDDSYSDGYDDDMDIGGIEIGGSADDDAESDASGDDLGYEVGEMDMDGMDIPENYAGEDGDSGDFTSDVTDVSYDADATMIDQPQEMRWPGDPVKPSPQKPMLVKPAQQMQWPGDSTQDEPLQTTVEMRWPGDSVESPPPLVSAQEMQWPDDSPSDDFQSEASSDDFSGGYAGDSFEDEAQHQDDGLVSAAERMGRDILSEDAGFQEMDAVWETNALPIVQAAEVEVEPFMEESAEVDVEVEAEPYMEESAEVEAESYMEEAAEVESFMEESAEVEVEAEPFMEEAAEVEVEAEPYMEEAAEVDVEVEAEPYMPPLEQEAEAVGAATSEGGAMEISFEQEKIAEAEILIASGAYLESMKVYHLLLQRNPKNREIRQKVDELKLLLQVMGQGDDFYKERLETYLSTVMRRRDEFLSNA